MANHTKNHKPKIEQAKKESNDLELRRLRQIGGYVFQTTASKEEYDCYLNGTLDSLHKTHGTIATENEQELLELKSKSWRIAKKNKRP